ncbi:MAG: hypothetical protein IJA79_00600 [Desulfovibrio sp.]|nr:hypothetical protein [Desulfovibrio sp.]
MTEELPDAAIFDHSSHIELWDWLAKNPECMKLDWPGWYTGVHVDEADCFACKFVMQFYQNNLENCNAHCPLEWPGGNCVTPDHTGLFNRWFNLFGSSDLETRAQLARQIRDLPVRAGVKCK